MKKDRRVHMAAFVLIAILVLAIIGSAAASAAGGRDPGTVWVRLHRGQVAVVTCDYGVPTVDGQYEDSVTVWCETAAVQ